MNLPVLLRTVGAVVIFALIVLIATAIIVRAEEILNALGLS